MNKNDLIDTVSEELQISKKDVTLVVDALLGRLKDAVAHGERVSIAGFGIFERSERAARRGRNPQTGEAITVKATKLPKFRPGRDFKDTVAAGKSGAGRGAKKAAKKTAAKPRAKR